MNCLKHENREAIAMCVKCHKLICEECAVKINNKYEFRNLAQICEMLDFPRSKFNLQEILIKALINELSNVNLEEDSESFPEGKKVLRAHVVRERNQKLVKLAKERFKEEHGKLYCEICKFDFEEKYGDIGRDYIEAHHMKHVCTFEENEETKISDLILVCSNCHKMLHRKRPWLTAEQIRSLIKDI